MLGLAMGVSDCLWTLFPFLSFFDKKPGRVYGYYQSIIKI